MRGHLRVLRTLLPGFMLMVGACVPMSLVACAWPWRSRRRFNTEVIGAALAKAILRSVGVTVNVRNAAVLAQVKHRQVVFISNHTSTLDPFVLLSLGLPRSRYFLKRAVWWVLPLGFIAALMGTFFTVPQRYTARRRALFQRAAHKLRRCGDSVYLSPEGTRVVHGGVGPFNRGAFHLAQDLSAPIVPLRIDIPSDKNPGKGLRSAPCVVQVSFMEPIATDAWQVDTLDAHIAQVRSLYLQPPARAACL